MSAAAPALDASAPAPVKKGKKKLIVIIAMVLLLLVVGGGAAVFLLKKKAAAAAEGDEPATSSVHADDKPDLKHPPTFLPLDPFVVNLSDKDADRYAQVGITFEVADAHFADEMKAFMPAIRNGILMILSHKSSKDLLDRAGKEQLAAEILRDASRTMGLEVAEPDLPEAAPADGDAAATDAADAAPKKKKKKKAAPAEPNPIKHVHFSNFIVQ